MVAYFIVISDQLESIRNYFDHNYTNEFYLSRSFLAYTYAILFIIPLSTFNLHKLQFSSLFGICLITLITLYIISNGIYALITNNYATCTTTTTTTMNHTINWFYSYPQILIKFYYSFQLYQIYNFHLLHKLQYS